MKVYLRQGDDTLDQAKRYASKSAAIADYRDTMQELHAYDQTHTASIHYANSRAELAEYPDIVLSRGPRGAVKVEPA